MRKKVIKILSIDGGGVRGMIPAMVLAEIEKRAGKPIAELFDVIAGSSIGSLLALGLTVPGAKGKPRYSAENLVKMFERDGEKIFSRSFWHKISTLGGVRDALYLNTALKKVLKREFKEVSLKNLLTEVVIPAYEIEIGAPFLFRRRDARKSRALDFLARDAVLASSAFPVLFKPHVVVPNDPKVKHYVFVDGAVAAANNPAMCAYLEAKTIFPDAHEYMLVSLGTGDYGEAMLYELTKRWGAAQWLISPFLNALMIGGSDMVDQQMKSLFSTRGDNLNHYYRFQPRIGQEEKAVDNASKINFHILKLLAENLITDEAQKIEEVCKKLLEF